MRQKYLISRNGKKDTLRIREYAVIDKNPKRIEASMLQKGDFSFLCEENYESAKIEKSISKGKAALISTLRTRNIYPIEPYAAEIAESVITLYDSSEENTVELYFDDVDLVTEKES